MRLTTVLLPEDLRLQDLYTYNILDTDEENDFTQLVELVNQLYACPVTALTFVDRDRLWFKAIKGAAAKEAPREGSPCDYVVSNDLLIVPDMLADERFAGNELLTQKLGFRFYAGAPIVSAAGHALGTVCMYDHNPRHFSARQAAALRAVANQANNLLQLKAKNSLLKQQAETLLQHEKDLLRSVLQQREAQRMSIGTELHENIAQGLAAAKLYLELTQQSVSHPFLDRSTQTVARLLKQVKELTHSIVPTTLQGTGLTSLLQILAERYRQQAGISVDCVFDNDESLPAELSLALYRIVEEAFENVWRHARASHIFLQVSLAHSAVVVRVTDNGVGLNLQHFKKGPGLGSIVSVTEYYGGSVDLVSDGKNGCALTVQVPLSGR